LRPVSQENKPPGDIPSIPYLPVRLQEKEDVFLGGESPNIEEVARRQAKFTAISLPVGPKSVRRALVELDIHRARAVFDKYLVRRKAEGNGVFPVASSIHQRRVEPGYEKSFQRFPCPVPGPVEEMRLDNDDRFSSPPLRPQKGRPVCRVIVPPHYDDFRVVALEAPVCGGRRLQGGCILLPSGRQHVIRKGDLVPRHFPLPVPRRLGQVDHKEGPSQDPHQGVEKEGLVRRDDILENKIPIHGN